MRLADEVRRPARCSAMSPTHVRESRRYGNAK